MQIRSLAALAATALASPALLAAPLDAPARAEREGRGIDHVFFIVMENHARGEIFGNTVDAPFINKLARRSAVLGNYYGVTHPSLPNYLAMISGSYQGIWDDCKAGASVTCAPEEFVPGAGDATDGSYLTSAQVASATAQPHWFQGKTFVEQLADQGRSWKAYMQSMPAGGHDTEYAPVISGHTVKLYAQKHNPFEYFEKLHGSANVVPFEGNFFADLAAGKAPAFSFISPDQCHDMHGVSPSGAALAGLPECGYPAAGLDHGAIALGDQFLEETVGKITASPAWKRNSAIVIIWDEDDYTGFSGCCESPTGNGFVLGGSGAPALVLTSRGQAAGRTIWKAANHYSMLGTLQKLYGVGCLENTCKLSERDLLLELFGEE
jgi:phosphatidylinositol-3-phosphatase